MCETISLSTNGFKKIRQVWFLFLLCYAALRVDCSVCLLDFLSFRSRTTTSEMYCSVCVCTVRRAQLCVLMHSYIIRLFLPLVLACVRKKNFLKSNIKYSCRCTYKVYNTIYQLKPCIVDFLNFFADTVHKMNMLFNVLTFIVSSPAACKVYDRQKRTETVL